MPGEPSLRETLRWVWRAWRYRLRHEPAEIAFLRRSLRPGDACADIGAHKGAYTYWMGRAVGAGGRVWAFEPQPLLAQSLSRVVATPNFSHVHVAQMALSSLAGKRTLFVPSGATSPSATLEDSRGADSEHEVVTDSLDAWLERDSERPSEQPLRLLKCDVEGHELDVLRGAQATLERDRPIVLIECEARHRADGDPQAVFAFLASLGYRGTFFLGAQRCALEDFEIRRHQVVGQRPYVNNFVFEAATS